MRGRVGVARAVKGGKSTALSPASEIFLLPLTQPALTRPSTCARMTQGFRGFGDWLEQGFGLRCCAGPSVLSSS